MINNTSAAAFAPLPLIALEEPAGRRGAGSQSARPAPQKAKGSSISSGIVAFDPPVSTGGVGESTVISNAAGIAPEVRWFWLQALANRIQFLRVEAELDEVPFSEASLRDFRVFLHEFQPQVRPALFLNDNGNLRALWKNEALEQVGLEFLGDGTTLFVIFKRRPEMRNLARQSGIDTIRDTMKNARACGAWALLFG